MVWDIWNTGKAPWVLGTLRFFSSINFKVLMAHCFVYFQSRADYANYANDVGKSNCTARPIEHVVIKKITKSKPKIGSCHIKQQTEQHLYFSHISVVLQTWMGLYCHCFFERFLFLVKVSMVEKQLKMQPGVLITDVPIHWDWLLPLGFWPGHVVFLVWLNWHHLQQPKPNVSRWLVACLLAFHSAG